VGQLISQMLSEQLIPFAALDANSARVAEGKKKDFPVFFGDAGERACMRVCVCLCVRAWERELRELRERERERGVDGRVALGFAVCVQGFGVCVCVSPGRPLIYTGAPLPDVQHSSTTPMTWRVCVCVCVCVCV
jgi:hypothetical protein